MNSPLQLDHLSPRARAWNVAMAAAPGALDDTIPAAAIDGVIPAALRGGRLLSNGPGWTRIGDRTVHPFDGHGYVRAFSFGDDNSVRLRARFIETPSYLAEAAAGRMVHRGFATNVGRHLFSDLGTGEPRNVANTTIVRWGDRLLAGWEAGRPYALDPDSLQTRGEDSFGGAIADQATLAHMHVDATQERMILCSIKNGRQTQFTFREVDRNNTVVVTRTAHLDGMVFTHDFAITPKWYVLGGNPLKLRLGNLAKMLVGRSTLLNSVAPDLDKPGVLHLVPRDVNGPVRTIALPDRCFIVHFGNAFEDDGTVVVDVCAFKTFNFGEEFGYAGPHAPFDPALPDVRGPQTLYRITIGAGATEAEWTPLTAHGVDFPRFHPAHEGQRTPVLFGATRKDPRFSDPFDSVIGVDLLDEDRPAQLWTAPENVFVGEPIFVPDADREDAGSVLVVLADALRARSMLAIFDATALAAGPIASVPLPLLPIGFHGEWDPKPE